MTIDWVRDGNRDRTRHKRLQVDRRLSWRGWATKLWDALSGWLIVFLVGVSSGLLAGKRKKKGPRRGGRERRVGEGRGTKGGGDGKG